MSCNTNLYSTLYFSFSISHFANRVKNDRQFAYEVLCGGRPYTQKPQFCPICDKGGESSSECQFGISSRSSPSVR